MLPKKGRYNKDFLKDVLAGRKKLFRRADTKFLEVPRYKELAYINLKEQAYQDPEVAAYLPDPKEGQREVDRLFFFTILSTLRTEWLLENIQNARLVRHVKDPEEEKDEVIHLTDEMYAFLHAHPFQSSKAVSLIFVESRGNMIHLL